MPRRSVDFENPRDNYWCRLWERPSKKSHRQCVTLRRLSSNLSLPEESVVPAHSFSSQDPVAMATNSANQSLEDQFLRWRQIWRQSRRNGLNRWLNYRAMLTVCSKKMIACGLIWKENILKRNEGAATLHPRANKIKARSLSSQTPFQPIRQRHASSSMEGIQQREVTVETCP